MSRAISTIGTIALAAGMLYWATRDHIALTIALGVLVAWNHSMARDL